MKHLKFLLPFCTSILLWFGVPATAEAQVEFGIRVAANASNYIKESDLEPGLEAGLFLKTGSRCYFHTELNYGLRNTQINGTDKAWDSQQYEQHFIDFPLLVGFRFIDKKNFKFGIFLGPRVGIRVADNWADQQTELSRAQWGGLLGANLDFWRFTLDLRYDISGNKFKENSLGSTEFWTQNIIELGLGFKIFR